MTKRPIESPYLVPFDGSFRVADAPTRPPKGAPGKKECKRALAKEVERLSDLQRILYAFDRHAVLLVFQAMDAAGKDGTIRAVTSGIDPTGISVRAFKKPSSTELDHDFLWRAYKALPERGRIGIFNRSHYEEVLVVRVHPEILASQQLPPDCDLERIWEHRYESIRDFEKHLDRNGIVVVKFFLNVSQAEQHRRFLARIDEPEKNWKFSPGDVRESEHWDEYMSAFETALARTSAARAPWYAIPADDKPFMRLTVARIVRETMESLDLAFPELDDEERAEMMSLRERLAGGGRD